MLDGNKIIDEVNALKMKYCSYWKESPQGDSYMGPHGYMDIMLTEAIKYGYEQGESFGVFGVW